MFEAGFGVVGGWGVLGQGRAGFRPAEGGLVGYWLGMRRRRG